MVHLVHPVQTGLHPKLYLLFTHNEKRIRVFFLFHAENYSSLYSTLCYSTPHEVNQADVLAHVEADGVDMLELVHAGQGM